MEGMITEIERFALNDGPGIRTTVFFKGCPLRCKWCANPESQKRHIQILWDPSKCLHCGTCIHTCPQQAVNAHPSLSQNGSIRILDDNCKDCRLCIERCPGEALKAEGSWMSVSEVMDTVLQDMPFYEESGGGVTLSGGEAFVWPQFMKQLLSELRRNGIHSAVETTGYVPENVFREIAPMLDLLLFDIKHWDEGKHQEGTGVQSRLILENMKWAIGQGLNVLPRMPVIPGYNNALSDAEGFAGRLKGAGAERVQLLPFHQFGEKKYEMLGREYAFSGTDALHEEDVEEFRQRLINEGIEAFF